MLKAYCVWFVLTEEVSLDCHISCHSIVPSQHFSLHRKRGSEEKTETCTLYTRQRLHLHDRVFIDKNDHCQDCKGTANYYEQVLTSLTRLQGLWPYQQGQWPHQLRLRIVPVRLRSRWCPFTIDHSLRLRTA